MEEGAILLIILLCFMLTLGVPILLFIIGAVKRKRDKDRAKIFFIIGLIWLLVGGGTCLAILGA